MGVWLDEDKVRETTARNSATSYGLSLVAGLPLAEPLCDRVQAIQDDLEGLLPGRFVWYETPQLHVTLAAPLRGRYRDAPPLEVSELPADLPGFIADVATICSRAAPFQLALGGVHLADSGMVLANEDTLAQRLAACLAHYPRFDAPKHQTGLHVSIGYLNNAQPFASAVERERFAAGLREVARRNIGRMLVREMWIVHYANRTMSRIVGRVCHALGEPLTLSTQEVTRQLGLQTGPNESAAKT